MQKQDYGDYHSIVKIERFTFTWDLEATNNAIVMVLLYQKATSDKADWRKRGEQDLYFELRTRKSRFNEH